MPRRVELEAHEVTVTYKGQTVSFTVRAATPRKAVAEARRMAKAQGMGRVKLDSVRVLDEDEVYFELLATTFLDGRGIPADHVMSLEEIRSEIEYHHGNDVTLKIIQQDGELVLDDGPNGQVNVQGVTALDLTGILYDWTVFVGLTNEGFARYLEDIQGTGVAGIVQRWLD